MAKKVLTEKDITVGGKKLPTTKQMQDQMEKELRKEAADTGAPRVASLARGVTARQAPQSAKAVSDGAAKAKAAAKPAKPAKGEKAAKAKEAKAAKAEAADNRKLKLTDKGEAKLAKLSASDRKKDRLQLMANAGTVAKALELSGVGRGDVNYALRTGVLEAK